MQSSNKAFKMNFLEMGIHACSTAADEGYTIANKTNLPSIKYFSTSFSTCTWTSNYIDDIFYELM